MAEVESYEFAVLVDGDPIEWFQNFYSEGSALKDAIEFAESLTPKGTITIERSITYSVDRKIVWPVQDEDF